jgi:hypothetical protein
MDYVGTLMSLVPMPPKVYEVLLFILFISEKP